jgi:murein DD-endopeptidase MepM/ murein hydrolase activator NlpD
MLVKRAKRVKPLLRHCWLIGSLLSCCHLTMAQVTPSERVAVPSLHRVEVLYGKQGSGDFVALWPVLGQSQISSRFGMRQHPTLGTKKFHHGLDIAAAHGTPVVAVASGTIRFAGWKGGYGRVVEIEHASGWLSRYAHAKSFQVRVGESVQAGQIIAQVGSSGRATGAHLHLEIEHGGRRLDPEAFWGKIAAARAR